MHKSGEFFSPQILTLPDGSIQVSVCVYRRNIIDSDSARQHDLSGDIL